jgi:shikimate dehydrogenase
MDLDALYVVFPVEEEDVAVAVRSVRALDLLGVSVTVPHKEAVIAALDDLTPQARALSAVNCISVRDGRLVGHNTDGQGFINGLHHELQFDPAGATCVVLGAGGAARAIVHALGNAEAKSVIVVNRTPEKAQEAAALAGDVGRVGTVADIVDAQLVVNATSVGMDETSSPVPSGSWGNKQVFVDVVYQPRETPAMRDAAGNGATVANGLGMLLYQAAAQIEWWTSRKAPVDVMRQAIERH